MQVHVLNYFRPQTKQISYHLSHITKYQLPFRKTLLKKAYFLTSFKPSCNMRLRMQKMHAFSEPDGLNQGSFLQTKVEMQCNT